MNPSYNINEIKASMKDPIIHRILYTPKDDFGSIIKAIDELYVELRNLTNRIEIQKSDIDRLCAENCQLKKIIIALDKELNGPVGLPPCEED